MLEIMPETGLKEGLNDWVLTRDMDWGIPIPLDEAKGKVLLCLG